MTDREKLIGLLETHCAVIGEENCKAAKGEKCSTKDCANCLADHLLSHGVTVREPQKPLTVEEIKEIYSMRKDHVWPHERKPPYLYLDSAIEKNDHLWIAWSIVVDFLIDGYREYNEESYGKTWRCWAEKPTEEERTAAEWL